VQLTDQELEALKHRLRAQVAGTQEQRQLSATT
jgi:hypothetical protein